MGNEESIRQFKRVMKEIRERPLTIRRAKRYGKTVTIVNPGGGRVASQRADVARAKKPHDKHSWTAEDDKIMWKFYIHGDLGSREVQRLLSKPYTRCAIRRRAEKLRQLQGEETL